MVKIKSKLSKQPNFMNSLSLCLIILMFWTGPIKAEEIDISDIPLDSSARITEQVEVFLDSSTELNNIRNKYSESEIYIGYGVSTVLVDVYHPEWALYRVQAYEQALENAKLEFIKSQGFKIQTDKILELENNLGIDPSVQSSELESGPSRMARIIDKIGAVVEGNIDQSLIDLNIDPEEFNQASKKDKQVLFRNSFRKYTLNKAYGPTKGLMPVMSIEGDGEDGSYSVGVVVIKTPATEAFANKIVQSMGQVDCSHPVPDKHIKERVKSLNLTLQQGIREVIDDYGCPAMISFGQWSNVRGTSSPSLNAQYKSLALTQARINADNSLVEFVSGHVNLTEENVINSLYEDFNETDRSGFITQAQFTTLNQKILSTIQTKAKTRITGMKDLYKWEARHPITDTKLVGVVRIWSPAAERSARGVKMEPKSSDSVKGELTGQSTKEKHVPSPVLRAQESF